MRTEGLKEREENEPVLDEDTNIIESETTIVGRYFSFNEQDMKDEILENIESTVKWCRQFESEMNLPKNSVSYTYSSGENAFNEDHSFESSEHNYVNYQQKKMRAFNLDSRKEELSFFNDESTVIRPVNILLDVGQTILIGQVTSINVKYVR
ncbi:unnamed protein product [Rotaria sordida]|uniref:Uncharacterized protein n=1 Tax=Rotaria sordida TaxID=392033 RepID=A0A819HL14_9BILA|nr:unnamed protein product [Rotaria sordida]CAF3900145.1 unnamed protein product [Rotaria sordida]